MELEKVKDSKPTMITTHILNNESSIPIVRRDGPSSSLVFSLQAQWHTFSRYFIKNNSMAIKQNDTNKDKENNPSTGNASNPSPHNPLERENDDQLLDSKAEKYLREVASIEDVPDARDQQEMDDILKQTGKNK